VIDGKVRTIRSSLRFSRRRSGGIDLRTWLIAVLLCYTAAGFGASGIAAQEREGYGLLPAPRPFTLDLYHARMAKAMLERVGVVLVRTGEDEHRSVGVRKVRIEYVGKDSRYPEPYNKRYDLRLNGRPLEWSRTYIEYDFRMVNMRMLFTYRNQRPVPDVPYYLFNGGAR